MSERGSIGSAEDAIMFFRDTRLCVSARAARQPSTSPLGEERSHEFGFQGTW